MRFSQVLLIVIFSFIVLILPKSTFAVAYDLIPPDGTLQRGQDVQFIIDIDTQGATVNNAVVGMTYNTQYLQYKNATPGDAMTTLSATQPATGQLTFAGSNSAGFSGSGTFAYVTFTLIATAPGSTQLCVLTVPSTTPTPAPTSPPAPTTLPQTGSVVSGYRSAAVGGLLLLSSLGLYAWYNRNKYESKPRTHKKHA